MKSRKQDAKKQDAKKQDAKKQDAKKQDITKKNIKEVYEEKFVNVDDYNDKEYNNFLLKKELLERTELEKKGETHEYLYPNLNDPQFNIKIAEKKEFNDTKYDGSIYDIEEQAEKLCNADFELSTNQMFVRNFLSFQTPYNSLLLYHGLGTGKTCSAITVAEEMRNYLNQLGINQRILIVASPNVQENFKLQLFDERRLKLVDGLWNLRACTGNKYLKEINPMNMKGLSKEKVIRQINRIIQLSYLFLGYTEFANYITKKSSLEGVEITSEKKRKQEMKRRMKKHFNNRLIIIDEVHNIRISEDNSDKRVAQELFKLVKHVDNLRLLFLSATPMYNSYKEIVWLLNIMNLNDGRSTIEISDVFDKNGNLLIDKDGNNVGEEIIKRKSTGYVSFVRGENPYTFPYRIFPSMFAPEHTFNNEKSSLSYPRRQLNGKPIVQPLEHIDVFVDGIGSYQETGYNYIIDELKNSSTTNKEGLPSFENMESFGYTMLQKPLLALNMIYPSKKLDKLHMNKREDDAMSAIAEESMTAIAEESMSAIAEESVTAIADESMTAIADEPITTIDDINIIQQDKEEKIAKPIKTKATFDSKSLIGGNGLKRIMKYTETSNPPSKKNFEYKTEEYGRIFAPSEIEKYSSKIKNITDSITNSNGIVLIYSQYIDGGLIPMALALEEIGFRRFGSKASSLFKKAPRSPIDAMTLTEQSGSENEELQNNNSFQPATYTMITGEKGLSPDSVGDLKALTNEDNKNGEKIKVVLISKTGAEGIDFKNIRQIHIMEPWYNLNLIEQIIGRGVRTCSHKQLPFTERNVEIFLYGTLLNGHADEAVDLYIYRLAEMKAVQIGRVSRILKESSVDCILNIDQTNFTENNFNTVVKQKLSNNQIIDYRVGDKPFTVSCDYMETCDFKCKPYKDISDKDVKLDSYDETFIMMNTEKIIQRVRDLFKERFYYTKNDLISHINIVKDYPLVQIYAALSQLIEDNNEYIMDKYGRLGHLINIEDFYLFQPIELNNPNISIYDRSVPIQYKRDSVIYPIEDTETMEMKLNDNIVDPENIKQQQVLDGIISKYNIGTTEKDKIERGEENWYIYVYNVFESLKDTIPSGLLNKYLIYHIIETLPYNEMVVLINYLYFKDNKEENKEENKEDNKEEMTTLKEIESVMKEYFDTKIITYKQLNGLLLLKNNKRQLLIQDKKNAIWKEAESEDVDDLADTIQSMEIPISTLNTYIGFIGDFKNEYSIFKVKNMEDKRSKGARCDQSGKSDTLNVLNKIINEDGKYTIDNTKKRNKMEFCIIQEMMLRYYDEIEKDSKKWFLSISEVAINHKRDELTIR